MTCLELSADLLNASQIPGENGLYFIGPFTPRITFYSQQVRALRLAHAMHALNVIGTGERVAVVGAGAAGSTMAVALALLGREVTLYDSATDILQLQSASSRLLHPHIYEWPRLGSLDDKAGLPIMDWSAGGGGGVITSLRNEFAVAKAALPNLAFENQHRLADVVRAHTSWQLRFTKSGGGEETRVFPHVVLAIGFGDERPCGDVTPEDYWRPGAIGTPASEPVAGVSYLVSGNGDGALTEAMGLLVAGFEHVSFTRRFLGFFTGDELRIAAEAVFASAALGHDVEPALRATLLPLLQTHSVLDRLRPILRRDRAITINTSGPLFAARKASQLNQCMVFAILEAAALETITVRRTTGYVTGATVSASGTQITGTVLAGNPDSSTYKHAILRHGPDIASRYAPAGALIGAYQTHVEALLAGMPALAAPPQLDMATYGLFEDLRIDKAADHASRPMQREHAATSKRVIEISIDPAAHVLVERGCRTVEAIALDCEQLPDRFTIDLHVKPLDLPDAAHLVRLARCSGGKIELRAGQAVRTTWATLMPGIALAPLQGSICPVREYAPGAIAACIDACLVRALDERVKNAVAHGTALPLGTISATILAAASTTWDVWRAALDADPALRFDFLRWLANVDQSVSSPWDGDSSAVQRMANALIMIAATHAQEPMAPLSVEQGNLQFSKNAVALGTGCEAIGAEPLSVRSEPDDWGVDALILSASNEVVVRDPPGRVLDGGTPGTTMTAARRVRPAIIQNDARWRAHLRGGLDAWKAAVAEEFEALRKRQDAELNGVAE